jgi:cyclopropane-fatty-acyl-phospholipid synthase
VAHHYDLSGRLYDLFLDRDRQYSCAYFTHAHDDIEQAQADKKRHIAAKLRLDEGAGTILDIGSGWGGLGLYLAKVSGGRVVGVTLSEEQHKLSGQRAQEAGLAGRVDFRLQDYRTLDGRFDRIVSVGMFEHVGKRHYREFFDKVHALLDDNGVALLHTIARFNEPGPIHPFMRKYIFPGADVPTLSEMLPEIEKSGLLVADIEILRLHYAETLRLWRKRFEENRAAIRALYDERFCRMWEAYLIGCEMGFRHQGLMVAQIQLVRRQEALPLTRDYMVDWERRQKSHERRPQAAE